MNAGLGAANSNRANLQKWLNTEQWRALIAGHADVAASYHGLVSA
jgi:hypothetical protein